MPLNSLHPRSNIKVSYWVLDKAKEIKQCVGILCDDFEDQFIALLAAIEAGQILSGSPSEINSAKKTTGELTTGQLVTQ